MNQESLESIEGDYWGPAPKESGYLIRTVHHLRAKSLDDLSPEDLRIMIGQDVGTVHLMPRALLILEIDPLVEGDFYPGDLLVTVLQVGEDYWSTHPAERRAVRTIAADLPEADPQVVKAVARFLKD